MTSWQGRVTLPPNKGSRKTHQKQRQKLRQRLRAAGVPDDVIERKVAELADRQQAARDAAAVRLQVVEKLRAMGAAQWQVDAALALFDARLAAAERAGVPVEEWEAQVDVWWAEHRLDDSGYRPSAVDPLARGAARATPATVRAARRAKATTRYEHDHREGR